MRFSISILTFLFVAALHSQCIGNLIVNGSFTAPLGEDVHAHGWNVGSTPDVNNAEGKLYTSTGYSWIDKPHASKNGGTWQNLYNQREYMEQTLDLKIGEIYTLRFEYAAQGIEASAMRFAGPIGINVYVNNDLVFTSPMDFTQYTWENTCYSFKATTVVNTIRLSASGDQYVGLDGICLVKGDFCGKRVP